MRSLWVVTTLVMWFCVCLCERVFGTVGWRVIRREDPSPLSIKVAGSLRFLLSPGSAHFCDCSRHTDRENINISKTSTDNSHPPPPTATTPLHLSPLILPSFAHPLFAFFPQFLQSLPGLSPTLQPSPAVSLAGKTSLSWREG